jgi:uncharacterized protein YukE
METTWSPRPSVYERIQQMIDATLEARANSVEDALDDLSREIESVSEVANEADRRANDAYSLAESAMETAEAAGEGPQSL